MNSYPKKCRRGRRRTKGLQGESNLKKRQVWTWEAVNFKHCLVNVSLMNVSGIMRAETCARSSQPGHRTVGEVLHGTGAETGKEALVNETN